MAYHSFDWHSSNLALGRHSFWLATEDTLRTPALLIVSPIPLRGSKRGTGQGLGCQRGSTHHSALQHWATQHVPR